MSARPPTADGYMCSGGKRAVLMPRFNQRVNPQTGRFCELRHKIYLNVANILLRRILGA